MSVEKNNDIELNLDSNYINCSTTALIREYLARKVIYFSAKLKKKNVSLQGLRKTLEKFDEENSENFSENINSRSKLVEFLNIQNLYEKNKVIKKNIIIINLSFILLNEIFKFRL